MREFLQSTISSVRSGRQTSAEWIAEAPRCPRNGDFLSLSDFGFADYGNAFPGNAEASTATVQGVTGAIGSFGQNVQESTW